MAATVDKITKLCLNISQYVHNVYCFSHKHFTDSAGMKISWSYFMINLFTDFSYLSAEFINSRRTMKISDC